MKHETGTIEWFRRHVKLGNSNALGLWLRSNPLPDGATPEEFEQSFRNKGQALPGISLSSYDVKNLMWMLNPDHARHLPEATIVGILLSGDDVEAKLDLLRRRPDLVTPQQVADHLTPEVARGVYERSRTGKWLSKQTISRRARFARQVVELPGVGDLLKILEVQES